MHTLPDSPPPPHPVLCYCLSAPSAAGPWLTEFTDLRDQINLGGAEWDTERLRQLIMEMLGRIEACGRTYPVPVLSARALARMEAEAGREAAIAEQQREEEAIQLIEAAAAAVAAAAADAGGAEGCGDGCGAEAPAAAVEQQQQAAEEQQAALAGV
jgi:hypothetical protein